VDVLPSNLVGRDAELSKARAILADARQHRVARLLRISGVSGIGKTAIAAAITEHARLEGWVAAVATSHRIQMTLPFISARKTITALIDALKDEARRYTSGLESEISAATASGSVDAHALEDVLLRLLEAVLLDVPLLLVIDDAQWADPESRTLFVRLLQALADRPLVLITTERSDESSAPAIELSDATITVDELDRESTADLARSLLPGASADVIRAVVDHARGRAIDVVTLANTVQSPAEMTPERVTATLRALVARDLGQLDNATREFLQICSLISDPIDYALLMQLWPDENVLLGLIGRCSGRYLVQEGESLHFVHTAIAQSIRETLPIEIPYRRRIIDAIERLPMQRLEDFERLVEQATACGDRSLETAYLERLLNEGERLQALPIVARALERIIATTPFKPDSLLLYAKLSMVFNALARTDDTHRVCSEALDLALSNGIKSGIGQLVVSELFALFFRGDSSAFRRSLERFDRYLTTPEDRSQILAAKVFAAVCNADEGALAAARSEFDALGVSDQLFEIRFDVFDAWRLARDGDIHAARQALDRAYARVREVPPMMRLMVADVDAQLAFQAFGVGHPELATALELLPKSHDTKAYISVLCSLASGNAGDVISDVTEALIHPKGPFNRRLLLGVAATSMALMGTATSSSARKMIDEEARLALRDHVSGALRPIAAAAAAINAQDDPTLARGLLAAVAEVSRKPIEPMIVFFPIVLVRAATLLQERSILEQIENGALARNNNPFNVAQDSLARYAARIALGKSVTSTELSDLAARFNSFGAPLFASLTKELGSAVIQPNTRDRKLTRREQQVASLIAEGSTNREIAENLVLSERTVEAHVANIFAKLDASSRAQVAVWYARFAATS
jgi:DNA-binding CsgD family transcriptional regulator